MIGGGGRPKEVLIVPKIESNVSLENTNYSYENFRVERPLGMNFIFSCPPRGTLHFWKIHKNWEVVLRKLNLLFLKVQWLPKVDEIKFKGSAASRAEFQFFQVPQEVHFVFEKFTKIEKWS